VTVTNGYLELREAEAYVQRQFADGSGILEDIITAVSRSIDRHCGRHFYQHGTTGSPVARYFEVEKLDELNLGTYNDLVSLSTLKTDDNGDGVFETTYSASQYVLCPVGAATFAPVAEPFTEIELLNGSTFPASVPSGREYLIEVTGVWGWPAVPIEVKHAARILCAEYAKLQDAPLGMTGDPQFGMSRIPPQKQRHVRELLGPYIHPNHVGIG
jgi:hypothetical protein